MSENSIHICCLSETCLNDKLTIPSHAEFVHYRLDREPADANQRAAEGVAIILRRELSHSLLKLPPTKLLECSG